MLNRYQAWASRSVSGANKVYTWLEHLKYGAVSIVALLALLALLYAAVSTLVQILSSAFR